MESRINFPLSERHYGEYKRLPNGGDYTLENIIRIAELVRKYYLALLLAEQELIELGAEKLYFRECLEKHDEISDKVYISPSKFDYFTWTKRLSRYKLALKSAEKQIEKINSHE